MRVCLMPPQKKGSEGVYTPPYGQVRVRQSSLNLDKLKVKWPKWLMSFEHWCLVTHYDPSQRGGPAYDLMRRGLLTSGCRNKKRQEVLENLENMRDAADPAHRPPTQLQVHLSKNTSIVPWNGFKQYGHSNTERGIGYFGKQNSKETVNLTGPYAVGPLGQLQWYVSSSFDLALPLPDMPDNTLKAQKSNNMCDATANIARVYHGAYRPQKADAADNTNGRTQERGCVSLVHRLAAIFGLYDYPGCEDAAVNWVQSCDYGFKVRMRQPDPAFTYIYNGNTLSAVFVKEPGLHEKLVGAPNFGFHIPLLVPRKTVYDQLARLPKDSPKKQQLAAVPLVSYIAPIAGVPGRTNRINQMYKPDEDGLHFSKTYYDFLYKAFVNTPFKGHVHAAADVVSNSPVWKGDLFFGWVPPVTLFLYPAVANRCGKMEPLASGTHHQSWAALNGSRSPYQPVPSWINANAMKDFQNPTNLLPVLNYLTLPPLPNFIANWAIGKTLKSTHYYTSVDSFIKAKRDKVDLPDADEAQLDDESLAPLAPPPIVTFAQTTTPATPQQAEAPDPGVDEPDGDLGQNADLRPVGTDQSAVQQDEVAAQLGSSDTPRLIDVAASLQELPVEDQIVEAHLATVPENSDGTEMDEYMLAKNKQQRRKQTVGGYKEPLPPGSFRRLSDRNGNAHFESMQEQAWPYTDLYLPNEHKINLKNATNSQIEEYREKYGGSIANMLLRGDGRPKLIESVECRYGSPRMHNRNKRLLDLPITAGVEGQFKLGAQVKAMFNRNLERIVQIYHDDSGALGTRQSITVDQKRLGMRNGIFVYAGKDYRAPVYKKSKDTTEVLCAVFDKACHKDLAKKTAGVAWVRSNMTVLQWLQTPWHYEYLPYQPLSSAFRDGETYCAGCVRCARPFYEYEHLYAPYYYQMKRFPYISHWVNQYYQTDENNKMVAPQPFHCPEFWSDEQVRMVEQAAEGEGGYHNWPTHMFLLGWESKDKRSGTYASNGAYSDRTTDKSPLLFEWRRRVRKDKLSQLRADHRAEAKWTFRRYLNHMPVSEDNLVQGVVRTAGARIAYGMQQYKLMRATKYTNVCRDCAYTLDLAPGLYKKNFRSLVDPKLLGGGVRLRSLDQWWLGLEGLELSDGDTFDPWFLHLYAKAGHKKRLDAIQKEWGDDWEDKYELHLEAMMKESATRCDMLQTQPLRARTKVIRPPDVYIQKVWKENSNKWQELEARALIDAQKAFKALLAYYGTEVDKTPPSMGDDELPASKEARDAMRDLIHDAEYRLAHLTAYKRDDSAPKYDPDYVRTETRNVLHNGYPNSLKIEYPVKGGTVIEPKYFHAERRDDEKARYPGMWRGDGFVTQKNARGAYVRTAAQDQQPKNQLVQYRPLTQSRLFITYSLHRAVTTETEARRILERMADAVRTLFGNDRHLCEMIVFGQRLANLKNPDTISSKEFAPITEPRKATKVFYGTGNDTSYLYDTYETHIDSVDVDVGVEIGPKLKHPHFHALLTINHYSYIELDYYRMKARLEQMFKGVKVGLDPALDFSHNQFTLYDAGNMPFYTDNENPYVDIKVYPADNWKDVIAAYIRKTADPGIFESLRTRPTN